MVKTQRDHGFRLVVSGRGRARKPRARFAKVRRARDLVFWSRLLSTKLHLCLRAPRAPLGDAPWTSSAQREVLEQCGKLHEAHISPLNELLRGPLERSEQSRRPRALFEL